MTREEKIAVALEQYEAIERPAREQLEAVERPALEQYKAIERTAVDDPADDPK